MSGPSGILLIDKPGGVTSRGVDVQIARLFAPVGRRSRGAPRFKVGHAGTLDPLATGLLLVLVGRGTRLQPFLTGLDKRYTATVRFGVTTDSLDRDGEVTARVPVPSGPEGLETALAGLRGEILQAPPVLSALKQAGRSLHWRARAGEEVAEPQPRRVVVHRLEATAVRWGVAAPPDDPGPRPEDGRLYEADLDLTCGSGTYVRSLARDLGRALGTEAHVHALRRLEIGPFSVAGAVAPDHLAAAADPGDWLRPLAAGLPHAPALTLDAERAAAVRQGTQPDRSWFPGPVPPLFRLLDSGGELVAVGHYHAAEHAPRTAAVFAAADPAARTGGPGRRTAED